jgi:hypothetical protein
MRTIAYLLLCILVSSFVVTVSARERAVGIGAAVLVLSPTWWAIGRTAGWW